MEQANLLALFWEGFEPVQHIQVDARTLRIRRQAKGDPVPVCSHCGRQVSQIHDVHWRQIEAVAMDMNTAFDLEVQRHCPNAAVVYDLFHKIRAAFPGKARRTKKKPPRLGWLSLTTF